MVKLPDCGIQVKYRSTGDEFTRLVRMTDAENQPNSQTLTLAFANESKMKEQAYKAFQVACSKDNIEVSPFATEQSESGAQKTALANDSTIKGLGGAVGYMSVYSIPNLGGIVVQPNEWIGYDSIIFKYNQLNYKVERGNFLANKISDINNPSYRPAADVQIYPLN
ncbi:MAG: hypothetical protein OHK0017_13730 [Patescibacteria group bacterium]